MKASELRIGNLVQRATTGEIMNVLAVDISSINERRLTVIPIPLTEEWLLKFEFTTSAVDDSGLFDTEFRMMIQVDQDFGGYKHRYTIGKKSAGYCPLIYVHTLQNLYFALTGTELTIKDN
jgi:hypothetical protein